MSVAGPAVGPVDVAVGKLHVICPAAWFVPAVRPKRGGSRYHVGCAVGVGDFADDADVSVRIGIDEFAIYGSQLMNAKLVLPGDTDRFAGWHEHIVSPGRRRSS